MIKASYSDKLLVVDILTESFDTNKSVNFVIKKDAHRIKHIRQLMEYAFEISFLFGEVYISEDKKGCALILYPDKKRNNIKSILMDLKLAFQCIGIHRITTILKREASIKKHHPKEPITYLWFIGVKPENKRKGIGTRLLTDIILVSDRMKRSIYLETSTLANIPWYEGFGLKTFQKLEIGYTLFLIKRDYAG